jgi:hypothetical protein
MVRRACLDFVGGFSARTRQFHDLDLWLRVLAYYDAAFIDRELSGYRLSRDSVTGRNRSGGACFDRLWIIENLMTSLGIAERYPQLAEMRAEERHMAWRAAVRGMLGMAEGSGPPRLWFEYLAYRVRRRLSPSRPPANKARSQRSLSS